MPDTIKAVRGLIDLGGIPLSVYMIPSGRYLLAGRNVTDAIDEASNSLLRIMGVKSLKGLPGSPECAVRALSGEGFVPVSSSVAVQYWATMAANGNLKAKGMIAALRVNPSLLGLTRDSVPVFVEKRSGGNTRYVEKEIRDRLAKHLDGVVEVVCPDGRIDVLTGTDLIEIKAVKAWKSAIGQVLVYGNYYPSHQKRIHFFGMAHSDAKSRIESHCRRLNIFVSWEE